MRVLSLLILAVSVAACSPSVSDLSPAEAHEAYEAALAAGDGNRAIQILRAADDEGDYAILRAFHEAYERGYLTSPRDPGDEARHLAFQAIPGEALLVSRRYHRARAEAAQAGNPEALADIAYDLLGSFISLDDTPNPGTSQADLDSVRVIYDRLVPSEVSQVRLAWIAKGLGDDDAFARHIDEGVAAGEPQACTFQLWFTSDGPDLSSTQGYVDYYDRVIACDPGEGFHHVADSISNLVEEIGRGNEAAVVAVDSLRLLGVFDRHPQLAPLVEGV